MTLSGTPDGARLTGPETPAVNVSNGTGDPIALSARLIGHVEAVLAPEIQSIGTVEGKLEGLIIHGKRRFLVYDPITERQVSCYFTPRVNWENVSAGFWQARRRLRFHSVPQFWRKGEHHREPVLRVS